MFEDRQQVADRLHSASLHLVRVVRTADAAMGLTPARASALSVLVFGGPRTIGGLARAEGVRSPTMTLLLNGLETDGLVRRKPSRGDRRTVMVEATPKARKVLTQGRQRRVELLEQLLGGMTEADLEVLATAAGLVESAIAARLPPATGATRIRR